MLCYQEDRLFPGYLVSMQNYVLERVMVVIHLLNKLFLKVLWWSEIGL